MAKVLKQVQKYINLEEELEAEQLKKVVSLDWRALDDLRKQDEANRASQRKDQRKHNNPRNNVKDFPDPFKQFSFGVNPAQMVNYLKGKKFVKWPKKMIYDPAKRDNSRYYAFHRAVEHMT